MEPVLTVSGLSKRFGDTVAVDGVDLELLAGQVHGLLGPNGAGKTSLLRMLLGLIDPDAGQARLLGRTLAELAGNAQDGVAGFVEDPSFYPYLSAQRNLELLTRLDGRPDASELIATALDRVGLAGRARDRVAGYSTGMRQRLGIAAALVRRPRLLLLDEPTSGLDPSGARSVAGLVTELAAEGVAVLLSSHQIGELERVCSHYSVMRAGRLVWSGDSAELEAQAPPSAYGLASSDDARATELAAGHPLVHLSPGPRGGLVLTARPEALEAYVAELARREVLIRRLEWLVSPLESMFFSLTEPPLSAGNDAAVPAHDDPDSHAAAERILARR